MAGRWETIGTWFERVADLPDEERAALLERECADAELRREVLELCAAEARAGRVLQPSTSWRRAVGDGLAAGDEDAGRRIGRWRLERRLGHGGMGTVWLAAREDDFEQRVAIKLLRRGLDGEDVLRRFRQERQVLAGLEHPGIARLIDGGATDEGRPFMVLEYVDGIPLDHWCERRGLDLRARLELFEQVCEAVQFAHRNLVVHRDLKPANILVESDGRVKLLDFGIAKLLDAGAAGITRDLDHASAPLTPEYASPEQVRGQTITTSSDVYSLGVVLYRLLTGALPLTLEGLTRSQVESTICERTPAQASRTVADPRLRRGLSGDLDTILAKALRKEPERRYASVEQLALDLRRHLDGLPVSARPDEFGYRASRALRRHRVAFGAAALVFATMAVSLVVIVDLLGQARRSNVLAERRHDGLRKLSRELVFELHDQVARLPGATAAREHLITAGLEQLALLRVEAAGSVALLGELAEAYTRLAEVQGRPTAASRGDTAGARATALTALEVIAELRSLSAAPPALAALEALALDTVATLELRLARTAEAEAHLDRALTLVDEHAPVYASLLHHRSQVLSRTGRTREAIEVAERCDALARARLEREPEDLELARTLQTSLSLLSELHSQTLDSASAEREAREALELAERLALARSSDVQAERDLGLALSGLARVLLVQGRAAEAQQAVERQLELFERLAAGDPDDAVARRDLSVAWSRRAELDHALGRGDQALDGFRRAVELARAAARGDRANAEARLHLALGLEKLADCALSLARLDETELAAAEMVEILDDLLTLDPDDAASGRTLPIARLRLAQVALERGEYDGALELFEQCTLEFAEVISRDPGDGWSTRLAMVARYFVGWTHRELGRDPVLSPQERREHLALAVEHLEDSLVQFEDLRERGLLLPGDEPQSREVALEIEACRGLLSRE